MADKVTRIGSGGRLYADAREEPQKEPELPRGADRPEDIKAPKARPAKEYPSVVTVKQPPTPPRDWDKIAATIREVGSTVIELCGVTAVTVGFWQLRPWAGLMAAGVLLIALGIGWGMGSR